VPSRAAAPCVSRTTGGRALHWLGDRLTLRAFATLEHARRVRFDAVSRADLCAGHGSELLDRAVRPWGDETVATAVV
jgi:hypothetical protein